MKAAAAWRRHPESVDPVACGTALTLAVAAASSKTPAGRAG